MDAIVEVETATVSTETHKAICLAVYALAPEVKVPVIQVFTSTLRVISQGNHSISAVAPDTNFEGVQLAVA